MSIVSESQLQLSFVKPRFKRAIVRKLEPKSQTRGGLLLPDIAQDKSRFGEVLAVSDDIQDVTVGDVVMFSPYMGVDFIVDEKPYLLLRDEDMVALVRKGQYDLGVDYASGPSQEGVSLNGPDERTVANEGVTSGVHAAPSLCQDDCA